MKDIEAQMVDYLYVLSENPKANIIGFPIPSTENVQLDPTGKAPRRKIHKNQLETTLKKLIFMMENDCTFDQIPILTLQFEEAERAKSEISKREGLVTIKT